MDDNNVDDNDANVNNGNDNENDDNVTTNLNGIDSHGSEAQPGVDAVEMRNRVWLPIFVLPLLIMIMMMLMLMMITAQ